MESIDTEIALTLEYLKSATPEQLHIYVAWANYDSNETCFSCIINNPKLDKATALMLYWNLGAAWYRQYASDDEIPSHSISSFRLIKEIEMKYLSNFYTNANIWFDPNVSDGGRPDEYPDMEIKRDVPAEMKLPVNGTEYVELEDENYDEGLPLELCEKLAELY